jgi:hypothetical protein
MPFDPAILLGPAGAVALLGYAVKRLWDSHDKSDADVIAQRNANSADLREATLAVKLLAAAIEQSNRDSAERRRLEDAAKGKP